MNLRFSQEIKSLLERLSEQPLTLGDILAETSERGFSLVITLLVLPFLFPMPPGLSSPLGGACLILSLQMVLGRRSPWLPKKIANFKFPNAFAQIILQNLRRVTRLLEKIARAVHLLVNNIINFSHSLYQSHSHCGDFTFGSCYH